VFVSEAKTQYDALAKLGLTGGIAWETHLNFVKATYAEMAKMDPTKLQEFIDTRSKQRRLVLQSFQQELDKAHTALDARHRLEEAARQARPAKRGRR
jgi:hypothetical protein